MKNPLLFLLLSFKRLLRKPSFLLILLLFPTASLLLSRIERREDPGIHVAVCVTPSPGQSAPDKGQDMSRMLFEDLMSHQGAVRFYPCENEDALRRDVALKKADCGYLIPLELGEKIAANRLQGAITVVSSGASSIMPISDEIVAAAIQELYSAAILAEVLPGDSNLMGAGLSPEELAAAARDRFASHLADGETFSFAYRELSGEYETVAGQNPPEKTAEKAGQVPPAKAGKDPSSDTGYLTSPVRGVCAVLVLLAALCGCLVCYDDKERGVFSTASPPARLYIRPLTVAAPAFLAAGAGVLCLALSGLSAGLFREWGAMLLYVLLLLPYCLLLMRLLPNRFLLCGAMPFLLLSSLVFPPVFVDLSAFSRTLSLFSLLFPPAWYLKLF